MSKEIEIWIDFNSPFSYLGIYNLEKALKVAKRDDLIISYRTFQIDPDFNAQKNKDTSEFQKYLVEQSKLLKMPQVKTIIEQNGINFNLKKVVPANSFNAHCLIHLEKKVNKNQESEVASLIFHAFWTTGLDISNLEILKKIAISSGMDEELVDTMLTDKQILNDIFKDEHDAINNGVSAVPHFKFPNGDQLQGLITLDQALALIKKNI